MVQVGTSRRSQRDYSDRQEPLGRPRIAPKGEKVVKKRLAKQERILNGNQPSPDHVEAPPAPPQSTHQQMTLLALLSTISQDTLASTRLTVTLQQIKAALFARDYASAFAKPDYLRAYVARWVPSRALAYREMFGGGVESVSELFVPREGEVRRRTRKVKVEKVVVEEDENAEAAEEDDDEDAEDKPEEEVESESEEEEEEEDKATRDLNVICIGGGAGSEVLALCAVVREQGTPARVNVQAVDMADWGMVLEEMTDVVEDKWRLSKDRINVKFIKQDVIAGFTPKEIAAAEEKALDSKGKKVEREEKPDYASANLITLLFTTAELLTASRASTLSFLSLLTRETKPGALLMIVESAGSFSALAVGKEKTFPLEFLLDFVLAGGKAGDGGGWEIVQKEESRWYRLPDAAAKAYPLRLENMRHMLRVYRRRG